MNRTGKDMIGEARGPREKKAETVHGTPVPRVRCAELLHGARELVIEHAGEEYRLRLTSKGKLILTK